MSIPLEDSQADVISKSIRGLGITEEQLSTQSGIAVTVIQAVRAGEHKSEETLRALAIPLGLKADALIALAAGTYPAVEPAAPVGLARFNTQFEDMTVNAYLVWDPASKEAAVFDSGADCSGIVETAEAENLQIKQVFLTHTHGDHVFDVERLLEKTKARFLACALEPFAGAELFQPGDTFKIGFLVVTTRSTIGHSKGGTTFVISGLATPVAVVGDALFAGSMGGGAVSFAKALETNRSELFSLSDDTIVCPGHGPYTTIGRERIHNPFYP